MSYAITYEVSATATCTDTPTCLSSLYAIISYSDTNGDSSQDSDAVLPWSATVSISSSSYDGYAVTAQLLESYVDVEASITCTVLQDGKQVDTNTSTGPGAVVDCSGEV